MSQKTFIESLKSTLDVNAVNRYFMEDDSGKTLEILTEVRPEGRLSGGRFQLASMQGGAGASADFNMLSHKWGDWSNGNAASGQGVVGFIQATLKCSRAQAVKWLTDKKYLGSKEARKALRDGDGNPLVHPIPEDKATWEVAVECDALRKDRGLITGHWAYHDLDDQLLGFKYRVDGPHGKLIYTLTYRAETGWTKKAWASKMVPLYGLQKLLDGPTVRICLVEGEKAADAAQELLGKRWKVLSFSGVSASHRMFIPDIPALEDAEIVLWPDNDSAGRDAMRRIQLQLQQLTHQPKEIRVVRVEAIPGLPPKWDLADWEEGCGVDVAVEMERAEEVDSFERICREWVYVSEPDQFHNLVDRHLVYSVGSFDRRYAMYGDKSGTPSKKFLSERDTYKVDSTEHLPGEPAFVTSAQGKTFLNQWFPTPVYEEARAIAENPGISDATVAANAKYFIEHVHRICGTQVAEPDYDRASGEPVLVPGSENRRVSDALFFYFSNLIKRPQDKSGWVPLLVSAVNGTGKSYFAAMVSSIFGGGTVVQINAETYVSGYEDWKDGCLFYEVQEVQPDGKIEVYDTVKQLHNYTPFDFTANPDRMSNTRKLNIKSRGMKVQRDFLNGMITSNHLFPLLLGDSGNSAEDRRLFVIQAVERLSDPQATALYDELTTHAHWVGAWLLRFTSSHHWLRGWAPVTEHKRAMFETNRERSEIRNDRREIGKFDDFYNWIGTAMRDKVGAFARQVISSDLVREVSEARRIRYPYDEKRFDKLLVRAGLHRGPDLTVDGAIRRCWASGEEWVGKPDSDWKAELTRSINGGI